MPINACPDMICFLMFQFWKFFLCWKGFVFTVVPLEYFLDRVMRNLSVFLYDSWNFRKNWPIVTKFCYVVKLLKFALYTKNGHCYMHYTEIPFFNNWVKNMPSPGKRSRNIDLLAQTSSIVLHYMYIWPEILKEIR